MICGRLRGVICCRLRGVICCRLRGVAQQVDEQLRHEITIGINGKRGGIDGDVERYRWPVAGEQAFKLGKKCG